VELYEAIQGRRSIRAFKSDPVPEEVLHRVLTAAIWAPSAGNLQPWEFVVVREPNRKRQLAKAALGQYFIAEAPIVVVVCANIRRTATYYGKRGAELYCIQDTAAATQNLLLAAHAEGLGACWIGAFREDKVASLLQLPPHVRPVAIVPIGYPAEKPRAPSRRPLSEVLHEETW